MSEETLLDDEDEMDLSSSEYVEYVTVTINGQLFGMPISLVEDIFMPKSITSVPLSDPEVEGVLNLRGRGSDEIARAFENAKTAGKAWRSVLSIVMNHTGLLLTGSARCCAFRVRHLKTIPPI